MSNMTNKIESSGMAAGRSSSGSYAALIQELQKKVFDQLNASIKSAVQGTENELFEAMEHAQDNDARSDCLDSIGFFRKHREAIADGFLSAHTDDFNAYFSGNAASRNQKKQTEKPAGLSLLGKEVHEENLLISTMAGRLSKQYSLELVVMRRRLAHLAGIAYSDETQSPLCPNSVVGSLQKSLQGMEVPSGLRTFLYMQFERHVMQGLRQTYEELGKFFSARNILPELTVDDILGEMSAAQRVRQQAPQPGAGGESGTADVLQASAASGGARQQAGDSGAVAAGAKAWPAYAAERGRQPSAGAEPGGGTPFQQQIEQQVSEINQLLGNYRNALGVVLPSGSRMLDSFAPPGASKNYNQEQIIQALQGMQRQRARGSVREEQNTDSFKQSMYQALAATSSNPKEFRVDNSQSNLIDLVGMLFDFVREEKNLADEHKNVLFHLQNLYCQVALRDSSFFHNTRHPAHLLLNRMVQAGNQYRGAGEQEQLGEAIETTVRQALVAYQHDDRLFERLLQQFDQQLEEVQKRVDRRERRAIDAAKGREKLVFARKHARGFVEVCVKRHNPPEIIREFLQAAWSDVLVFYFLRTGPSSPQWQEKARIAEELAWSCTPLNEEQQKKFVARKEPMMAGVQQALEQLGCYSDAEIQRLIQDIQTCQQAVQTQQHAVVESLSNSLPSSMSEADEEELRSVGKVEEPPLDEAARELTEKLKHVRFGTWFDFKEPPQRLKLAWFSPTTHRYMFVDSSGQGSYIKSWNELFEQLRCGKASIVEAVDTTPFFERALQAIQRTLKQFAGTYVNEIRKSRSASV